MMTQGLYDLSFLEQMNDKNFTMEVISLYLKDTNKDLDEMKQAFDTGDLDTICKTAHKLKSSTGLLQADTLFNILEAAEKAAKAGNDRGELAFLMDSAQSEFSKLKTALERELQLIQQAA